MANRIRGCEGTIHLTDQATNLQVVVDTQNITITEAAETETISVHGDCAQQTLSSSTNYEVSFDGLLSSDDVGQSIIAIGETVPWTWYLTSDQSPTGASYSGQIVINSIERAGPADARLTFSLSGSGSGALVKTNTW